MRVEHARPYEERRRLQLEAMKDRPRYRFVFLATFFICSKTHNFLSTITLSVL